MELQWYIMHVEQQVYKLMSKGAVRVAKNKQRKVDRYNPPKSDHFFRGVVAFLGGL